MAKLIYSTDVNLLDSICISYQHKKDDPMVMIINYDHDAEIFYVYEGDLDLNDLDWIDNWEAINSCCDSKWPVGNSNDLVEVSMMFQDVFNYHSAANLDDDPLILNEKEFKRFLRTVGLGKNL